MSSLREAFVSCLRVGVMEQAKRVVQHYERYACVLCPPASLTSLLLYCYSITNTVVVVAFFCSSALRLLILILSSEQSTGVLAVLD